MEAAVDKFEVAVGSDLEALDALDVLELSEQMFMELAPGERSALKLKSADASGLKDIAVLKQRILEYCHLRNIEKTPIALASLTRRFNRAAKVLGVSVNEIVRALSVSGDVLSYDRNNKTLLLTVRSIERQREYIEATYGATPPERLPLMGFRPGSTIDSVLQQSISTILGHEPA